MAGAMDGIIPNGVDIFPYICCLVLVSVSHNRRLDHLHYAVADVEDSIF